MNPRIEALIEFVDAERAQLLAAVETVPPSKRNAQPPGGGWSVALVLEHLHAVERGIVRMLGLKIGELRAKGVTADHADAPIVHLDRLFGTRDRSRRIEAPERIQPRGALDAGAARAALAETRAALRETLRAGADVALARATHVHPVLGEMDLEQWVLFIGYHEARHADQIRSIAEDLEGRDGGRGTGDGMSS